MVNLPGHNSALDGEENDEAGPPGHLGGSQVLRLYQSP